MSNDVFFLGAGFSKAIYETYPTLKELSEYVKNEIQDEEVNPICEHYKNGIPEQLKNNVEALLSYLSADWPWKNGRQRYENLALYEKIIEKIQLKFLAEFISFERERKDIEKGIILPDFGDDNEKIAKQFFEYILKNNAESTRKDIITLNYDLVCEAAFNRYKTHPNRIYEEELYQMPIPNVEVRNGNGFWGSYSMPNTPHIIKLHGSVNWYWAGRSPTDVIYYVSKSSFTEVNLLGLQPCIIPPVMDKTPFYDHAILRGLWETAERKLKKADNIYIIGFSFPPSDLSVRFLFQSALQRTNAPNISIINTDASEKFKENCKDVFGKIPLDYTYCCEDAFKKFVLEYLKTKAR